MKLESVGSKWKNNGSSVSAVIERAPSCPWPQAVPRRNDSRLARVDRPGRPGIRASFLRRGQLACALPESWIDYACQLADDKAWMHYYLWEAFQVLELFGETRLDGLKILEPGCGAGVIGSLFAMMGAKVTLFDNDASTLARAREHSDALGITSAIEFVEGDMLRCELPRRSFDLVWNDGTIEHFDDPVAIVQSMACMARPGGRVIVTVPNKWTAHTFLIRPFWRWRKAYTHDRWGREKSFSQTELQRLLEQAGLRDVRTNTHHLRRAVIDDRLRILQILTRLCRPLCGAIINALDAIETELPGIQKLGFMTGACGTVR